MTMNRRPRSDATVTLTVRVVDESTKAVAVVTDQVDGAVWLPRSLIALAPADAFGWDEMTLPEWKAKEAGLL